MVLLKVGVIMKDFRFYTTCNIITEVHGKENDGLKININEFIT